MSRTPVESTVIRSLGYDATRRVLEVEFTRGAVYEFADVPPRVFDALLCAQSVGRTFNELVRDRYASVRALSSSAPSPPART